MVRIVRKERPRDDGTVAEWHEDFAGNSISDNPIDSGLAKCQLRPPMKRTSAISAVVLSGLVGCDTMNRPISSGDFDPLRAPGSGSNLNVAAPSSFSPGQFVKAAMNNTAFFIKRPKGEADADKLLTKGTSMKVISLSDSYVKVELDGTGEVGWVPSVQLEDPSGAASGAAFSANPGEYQIYPPLNGGAGEPLPLLDPKGLPPDGAIPTVIDPDASTPVTPVPKVDAPTGGFEAPAEAPKKESTPLPPNGEELEGAEKGG